MTAANPFLKPAWGSPFRRRGSFRLSPTQRAWCVWAVSATFVLFQFFVQLTAGEMVSGLMQSFHVNAYHSGLIASSYYYIYMLLQAPAGLLVDRFGSRRLLSAGALVLSLGCLVFALAPKVWVAIVGRLLMGAGASFAFVGCLNVTANWFPVKRFGIMVAIAEVFAMLGSAFGGLGLAAAIIHYGWRQSMLCTAVIGVGISALLWRVIRDRPPGKLAPAGSASLRQFIPDLKRLMNSGLLWCNAIYSGLMFTIITVFIALWAIPFIETAHHLHLIMASGVCDMTFVGAAIGCPLMGALDARLPIRRALLVLMPWVSALMMSFIVFVPGLPLWAVYFCFLLLGIGVSSYMLTFVIGHQLATEKTKGVANGFVNMFAVGMTPLLQPFLGYCIDHGSGCGAHCQVSMLTLCSYQYAFGILIVGLLLAGFIGGFLPKKKVEK